MYQDREPSRRYIKRKKSRRSSSMMMFAIGAALLVTGGALGMPWLTSLLGDSQPTSSANEAGIVCPASVVGLTLVSDGDVESNGDLFVLTCEYVLSPSETVSAAVSVTWTENGPVSVLQRGCGLPPSITPGVFTVEGSYYGSVGQARADYEGQTRYANAMQTLAANLVGAAGSVSEPCPEQTVGTNNPGTTGGATDPGPDGTPGTTGTSGPGGSGTPSAGNGTVTASGTPVSTATAEPDDPSNTATGFGELVSSAEVPAGSCIVQGRITDSNGIPVTFIQLSVHDSSRSLVTTTSSNGAGTYRFEEAVEADGTVVLTPTDAGHGQPIFRIFAEQAAVTLSRDLSVVQPEEGICEVNFDTWNLDATYEASDGDIERWPSIIELYQNFNNAAELAVQLEAPLDYGLPIPVYAWCSSSDLFCDPTGAAEFAFFSGSTTGRNVTQPYIALGFPSSDIDYRGVPDNREYHEFGHAFLADVVGDEIPIHIGDQNHGGYYRNERTTDSYIEGFAEFYSVMVSKHIDGSANPQRYKIGAEYDIEADRKPWEAVGWWEEFTLAGLLLDFEDGPEDYSNDPGDLDVESVSALSTETGNFAIGRVRNLGTRVTRGPEVTVNLIDDAGNAVFTQVTAVRPDSLGPGQTGVFYVAAPEGVEFSEVDAVPGRPAGSDDDDVDLELSDIIRVVTSDWGSEPGRVTTVKELYGALSDAFAGVDIDDDGTIDVTQAQIDDIFIRHGFFDDLDGNRAWNAASDGEIGGTSHPAATIGRNEFPEIMPRSSAVGFSGSFVEVDTAGVDADLLVQVELADERESYSYWADSGTMLPVELAVPAAEEDAAAVTVIAAAPDHNPAVAYRTTAQQFHAAVESGEITNAPVQSSVQVEEGDPFALLGAPSDSGSGGDGDSERAGAPPWTVLLTVALAALMLGGGFYLMRRTGNAGGSTGGRGN